MFIIVNIGIFVCLLFMGALGLAWFLTSRDIKRQHKERLKRYGFDIGKESPWTDAEVKTAFEKYNEDIYISRADGYRIFNKSLENIFNRIEKLEKQQQKKKPYNKRY